MATRTSIEWTDVTWSPIIGCTRVSRGCDGCYAISSARIRSFNPNPKISEAYAGTTSNTDRVDWTGKVNLLEDRLLQPLSGTGIWRKPCKVFVNSQSDLFHEAVPEEFIARIFAVMACAPQHTFQVLTKRHGRMRALMNSKEFVAAVHTETYLLNRDAALGREQRWPLPNVWMGVSAEDQRTANLRVPALLRTPAAVRFISAEPLLGPVDLTRIPFRGDTDYVVDALDGRYGLREPRESFSFGMAGLGPIDWVIAGGESGPKSRPMHPGWARSLRDQCSESRRRVPFLFKQWGEYRPFWRPDTDGRPGPEPVLYVDVESGQALPEAEVPDTGTWTGVYRLGKKKAGNELDGRTWLQTPALTTTNTETRR
ncbi:phage Gp37/Gp68 family protein [[Kitasatospora] papulosa]|uniref:phage Gp37/Gp68 family protein n=1 Tax=[Kitasatospora] papulosa TaxID=1464011 RepID=UPI0036BF29B4